MSLTSSQMVSVQSQLYSLWLQRSLSCLTNLTFFFFGESGDLVKRRDRQEREVRNKSRDDGLSVFKEQASMYGVRPSTFWLWGSWNPGSPYFAEAPQGGGRRLSRSLWKGRKRVGKCQSETLFCPENGGVCRRGDRG